VSYLQVLWDVYTVLYLKIILTFRRNVLPPKLWKKFEILFYVVTQKRVHFN
jgi:hypothetical protein